MINSDIIKERMLEIDENLKYLKIDLERIYHHLQNFQDFREFQKHILAYIK